jgi:hypothetical protein
MARCSQPQAVLRGGLLASGASVRHHRKASKSPRCFASELGGHATPDGMPYSNLKLLYGNQRKQKI